MPPAPVMFLKQNVRLLFKNSPFKKQTHKQEKKNPSLIK
jgi:hypothetical protein